MCELKPCPFCGKDDSLVIESLGCKRYVVRCFSCKLQMGQWFGLETVVEAWNTRCDNNG